MKKFLRVYDVINRLYNIKCSSRRAREWISMAILIDEIEITKY